MFPMLAFVQAVALPTPRALGPATVVIPRDFVQIMAVAERRDGRLVVVDRGDELVAVVDLTARSVTPIGRVGGGPGEYRFPGRLIPTATDSLILADDGNNRLQLLGPDGRFHRLVPRTTPGLPVELTPRVVGARGQVLAVIPGWVLFGEGQPTDSLPIIRFTPGAAGRETVAKLKATPEPPPPPRRDRPRIPMMIFGAGDAWAATPSGRIAIVRAPDFRIEWIAPDGGRTVGPLIAWKPVPVAALDRTNFARRFLATSGVGGKGGADRPPGSLTAVPADEMTDEAVAALVANSPFATTKPPFTDATPIIAADGTLWLERSVPAGKPAIWDLFDGAGRPVRSWELPAGRRLVAVGRSAVYLVARDADDNERLERYALPD